MSRNINIVEYDVIKDEFGNVYPSGCAQYIPCDAVKVEEQRVATDISQDACAVVASPGDILPLSGSAVTNVLCYKLQVPNKGFVWVSKTSYDANNEQCNDCCNALTTLATPANFTASNGDDESVLNWDDVPNATGYVVEMATNSSFTGATTIYTGAVSGHTETGLTQGTQYWFRVWATASGYLDSDKAVATATPV